MKHLKTFESFKINESVSFLGAFATVIAVLAGLPVLTYFGIKMLLKKLIRKAKNEVGLDQDIVTLFEFMGKDDRFNILVTEFQENPTVENKEKLLSMIREKFKDEKYIDFLKRLEESILTYIK